MIRESLKKSYIGMNKEFRFRGEEPGRLENFSDAVFALAVTLLLISTTPPTNFDQIKRFAYEFFPFLACIALILLIWYEHFIFFLRYGLRNRKMIFLNTLFLVIVLFYVYPLKFLTKIIILGPIALLMQEEGILNEIKGMINRENMGQLMVIYGVGAVSVFLVLILMYRYALQKADGLELNEIEIFDTKASMRTNLLMAIVPAISVTLALFFINSWLAGPISGSVYFLYTPIMFWHGRNLDRKRKALLQSMS